jgi:hypothetical protein
LKGRFRNFAWKAASIRILGSLERKLGLRGFRGSVFEEVWKRDRGKEGFFRVIFWGVVKILSSGFHRRFFGFSSFAVGGQIVFYSFYSMA